MPRHATPTLLPRREVAGRWRNLISRLMSLLIAHPSPRRLFIGADRDRPWLVAVPFLPLRSSSLPSPIPFIQPPRPSRGGKRKRKNIDPLGGEGEKGRRRFHRSARFIREKSRRGHVSRVPLVSPHHALVYFPTTNLSNDPSTSPRVPCVSISSHE